MTAQCKRTQQWKAQKKQQQKNTNDQLQQTTNRVQVVITTKGKQDYHATRQQLQ